MERRTFPGSQRPWRFCVSRAVLFIAPNITQGELRRSRCSPAMKVCVPQCPNGALALNRVPRRLRPVHQDSVPVLQAQQRAKLQPRQRQEGRSRATKIRGRATLRRGPVPLVRHGEVSEISPPRRSPGKLTDQAGETAGTQINQTDVQHKTLTLNQPRFLVLAGNALKRLDRTSLTRK